MATYLELYTLRGNPDLKQKIAVALTIAADTIRGELASVNGHTSRITWAQEVLGRLDAEAEKALTLLLAANQANTTAQIQGASDSAIQSNVNDIINILAGVPNV